MTQLGKATAVQGDALYRAGTFAHQNAAGIDTVTTMYRASMPRVLAGSDLGALTTQVLTTVGVYLARGETVTNITFISGGTAAGTPTNWWFALYSPAGALLGQTADQTTTAWGTGTAKTLPLATAYTTPTEGWYWVGIMVKATTVPTLAGANCWASGLVSGATGQKILAQTSGSALTTTAPSTIASPATTLKVPLVELT